MDDSRQYLVPVRIGRGSAGLLLSAWGNPLVADCGDDKFDAGTTQVLETLRRIHPLPGRRPPGPTGTAWSLPSLLPRYLATTRETHRYVPVVGGDARIRLDLTLEKFFVPLRAVLHRSLVEEKARWIFGQLRPKRARRSSKGQENPGSADEGSPAACQWHSVKAPCNRVTTE